MSLLVVILAGGEGRRMGGEKPLRRFGDTSLIGRALALARGYGPEVAVALRRPEQAGGIEARVIRDDPRIEGPLGGLAAALTHARAIGADRLLTLPCDMPNLPPDLADRLGRALAADHRALVAVARSSGREHPVCALWRTEALDRTPGYVASGARSLRGLAEACDGIAVDWPAAAADPFANANTPEQLAALQPRAGVAPAFEGVSLH